MKKTTLPDVIDLDFIAIRHKLLDVAAFLDRVERLAEQGDFRVKALEDALPLLQEPGASRVKRILEHFSDLSEDPIDVAPGKGACGAVPVESNA